MDNPAIALLTRPSKTFKACLIGGSKGFDKFIADKLAQHNVSISHHYEHSFPNKVPASCDLVLVLSDLVSHRYDALRSDAKQTNTPFVFTTRRWPHMQDCLSKHGFPSIMPKDFKSSALAKKEPSVSPPAPATQQEPKNGHSTEPLPHGLTQRPFASLGEIAKMPVAAAERVPIARGTLPSSLSLLSIRRILCVEDLLKANPKISNEEIAVITKKMFGCRPQSDHIAATRRARGILSSSGENRKASRVRREKEAAAQKAEAKAIKKTAEATFATKLAAERQALASGKPTQTPSVPVASAVKPVSVAHKKKKFASKLPEVHLMDTTRRFDLMVGDTLVEAVATEKHITIKWGDQKDAFKLALVDIPAFESVLHLLCQKLRTT